MAAAVPWVEKYRPTTLPELVGNTDAIGKLMLLAKEGNLPNLLLCGPPGTGKTTSMLCLANDLLVGGSGSREMLKEAVMELNASDDRGLDVVREKIKLFAQTRKTFTPAATEGGGGGGGGAAKHLHKIVILDEADSMTPAAQQALRRTMEIYSHSTRFAFACNNSNKIIEPIQSRCAIIRYKKLSNTDVITKILSIMKAEGILHEHEPEKNAYTEDGLGAILYLAEGDLRHAINTLQATYVGYRFVSAENVFKVCDQPHPVLIENILISAIQRRSIKEAHAEMNRLLHRGYAPADLLSTFFRVAQHNVKLYKTELQQVEVLKVIGETTMRMAEGVSSALQLAGMLARIIEVAEPAGASAT